jgi:hypothetical protein
MMVKSTIIDKLRTRFANLLGVKVDLSSADWMEDPIRQRVLSERLFLTFSDVQPV